MRLGPIASINASRLTATQGSGGLETWDGGSLRHHVERSDVASRCWDVAAAERHIAP